MEGRGVPSSPSPSHPSMEHPDHAGRPILFRDECASAMRGRTALAALALVLLGALAYANSLCGPFVLDDLLSLRDNPHVRALWPPLHWLSLDPQSSLSGRPLATLSFALCHAFAGLDVRVLHAVNVALHLANGVLLLALLRTRLPLRAAFAGALLWTLHP